MALRRIIRNSLFVLASLLIAVAVVSRADAAKQTYALEYRVEMKPDAGVAAVTVRLTGAKLPSRIVFVTDPARHRSFRSSSPLQMRTSEIVWKPRASAAELHYEFILNRKRGNGGYDSYMTRDWALFRGDKLVPPVRATSGRDLHSRAVLRFSMPAEWTVVTALGPTDQNAIAFDDPDRRFDRPSGWMLAGKLGRRIEHIAGVTTTVAAPVDNEARRQDMLAFLNWNLPHLIEVFPKFPQRLLVVSAGDPMWRGGLSGPGSLFIHADRPLISENRTSTLLHELVHVAMGVRSAEDSDWIVEGLAEYYSLETLRRSRGISKRRYEEALAQLERWSRKVVSVRVAHSSGPVTAKAVLIFNAADAEIRAATDARRSLDDVAARLAEQPSPVTLQDLQRIAREIAGRDLRTLARVH